MLKLIFFITLLCASQICEAYKVLLLFPIPGKSHTILGDAIARLLVEAGHEVTYVTAFPNSAKPHPALREIDVSSLQEIMGGGDVVSIEKIMKKEFTMGGKSFFLKATMGMNVGLLEHKEMIKLLNDPKEQFDVLIADWMFVELFAGIAAVYNCPYIWASPLDPYWMIMKIIDEVTNPATIGEIAKNGVTPYTFKQRVTELYKVIFGLFVQHFYVYGMEHQEYERLLVPYIKKRGLAVPDYEELRFNASLVLSNYHVSTGHPIRLPQNYKPVAGYHIDLDVKPLPKDLKQLLDNAKNGLIYFSMGSNLRSKHMPADLKASFLKMFGKLKYTVLWKFEEDLPNRPSNVHIVQWAPQHSILAHPNCVLFITHGGLLSTTEAIHFAKPIIGIPVFGDQFGNIDNSVRRGFAKRVDLTYTMADELGKAINDILSDPSYLNNAKALSFIYHDRPVPPGKEVVHWVEHVVRTGGAPHLRSPALLVPWYQKCFLDLISLIAVILFAVVFIVKKLYRAVFPKRQQKEKKQ